MVDPLRNAPTSQQQAIPAAATLGTAVTLSVPITVTIVVIIVYYSNLFSCAAR